MTTATALDANPFSILGVTVRDDRQQIVLTTENRMLDLDHDLCVKARSDLTNPRARLGPEVGWLPGVSPRRATQLVERVRHAPDGVLDEDGLPILARANLLAAGLERYASVQYPGEIIRRMVQFARIVAKINPADVIRDINEDRAVARFPLITGEDAIAEHLAERTRYYRSVMRAVLDRLPPRELVGTVTKIVSIVSEGKFAVVPPLIDDLIDLYELEAQAFLFNEAENIKSLLTTIRELAPAGEEVIEPLVGSVMAVTRNWDAVAQPVQVGLRARGLEHELSSTLGFAIRSLAVDLCNEYDMLSQARRLTDLMREVFAELPEFAERLDGDVEALEGIEAERAEATGKRAQWNRDISFRAEIGVILKDVLSISPQGITWQGKSYPLETIARVRWGATRHSVNGIPTGTTYTIGFGDRLSTTVVETRKEEVFDAFVEKLWKAVGVRLLLDTLRDLQEGREWRFDGAVIRDDGITMIRRKAWSTEPVHIPWRDVRVWSASGSLHIASKSVPSINASCSYINNYNTHILGRILATALDRQGLTRLSEMLK